jgi:hypothetical protein
MTSSMLPVNTIIPARCAENSQHGGGTTQFRQSEKERKKTQEREKIDALLSGLNTRLVRDLRAGKQQSDRRGEKSLFLST